MFTLSDMNISENSRLIIIKFHLEYHWGGGLAAFGFGPDPIRTLVSMATDRVDIICKKVPAYLLGQTWLYIIVAIGSQNLGRMNRSLCKGLPHIHFEFF